MKKDSELQEVPYKHYPKILLYMLKNYIKSINYKSKNNIDKKIIENMKEYNNLKKKYDYNATFLDSDDVLDYKTVDREIDNLKEFLNELIHWYELIYDNPTINGLFNNEELLLTESFFRLRDYIPLYIKNSNFINEPNYKKIYQEEFCSHFKIDEKGIIYDAKDLMGYWNDYGIIGSPGKYIEGKHIKDVKEILESNGYYLENIDGNLDKLYKKYNEKLKLRELVLTTALYIIIKRGDVRFGPRRGLLFAKEYGLNIDIPMTYGVEGTYYNDYKFINIYLNNGGNKDLKIFVDYFSSGIERCFLEYITIEEFINNQYSKEEDIKKLILKNTDN